MASCRGVHASKSQAIVCVTPKASLIVRGPSLSKSRMPTWCTWKAREQAFVLTMPLDCDHLIELSAFNGDMDKIAGYICHQDISKEATEIREPPPNGHLAPCEGAEALSRTARRSRRSSYWKQ